MAGELAYIDRCHQEMRAVCIGPASTVDEPVCYVGVGVNQDLSLARVHAVNSIREYVLAQARDGVKITALSPIHIYTQVPDSPPGPFLYTVRAWVRYTRKRR